MNNQSTNSAPEGASLTNFDTEQLARQIAARIAPDALLDADDVGALLKCSGRYVSDFYAKLPGFPRAVRLPTRGQGRGHPRWVRTDVSAWVMLHKPGSPSRGGRPRKMA